MAQLRVMTFNVRQIDADDGVHGWEFRKDLLVDTIRLYRPELLATQETFTEQADYILAHRAEFAAFGSGRYGDHRDKHNTIFYDWRQMELVETGDIWISTTPEIPGSSDWDIPKPRMITWGKLRLADGCAMVAMNVHFPYGREADEARRQTARLIREKLSSFPSGMPIVLTGDFNTAPGGEVHTLLTQDVEDAWVSAVRRIGPDGTLHGFGRILGRRLDWVLHRNLGRVLEAETVTHTAGGLYPSDHYPVCVLFEGVAPVAVATDTCKAEANSW